MPKQRINIYIDAAVDCNRWLTDQTKNEVALINYLSKIAQKQINTIQNKNTNYKSSAEIEYGELV